MKRRADDAAERAQSPLASATTADGPLAPRSPATQNRAIKRSCGSGASAFLPPGALPPSAAAAWAENLLGAPLDAVAAALAACPGNLAPALPGLARLLQAAAELDAALRPPAASSSHPPPSSGGGDPGLAAPDPPFLLPHAVGYTSLTRRGRASLWQALEGAAPALAADAHACLLARLLLADAAPSAMGGAATRPYACATRLALQLPPSMAGWAARWGLGAGRREVGVLLLTAHARPAGEEGASGVASSSVSSVPAWRVAVPLLPPL